HVAGQRSAFFSGKRDVEQGSLGWLIDAEADDQLVGLVDQLFDVRDISLGEILGLVAVDLSLTGGGRIQESLDTELDLIQAGAAELFRNVLDDQLASDVICL